MNKIVVVAAGIVAAAGAAILVSLTASGPDLDAVIASQNCTQLMALTGADLIGATAKQQIDLAQLVTDCTPEEPTLRVIDEIS
ncbi:MAG: hypothetical protein MPI95_06200 [Nitrosopumilus sp.]|nr:hypothetical protein [Nitrosopumilus sp.]MDA7943744.1 hypothetical protein [Nitrosopumilus sp.]MDA7953803.1 hypothetical protein [Nitrosopumilus sp.]MDA7958661.1 hypothetical protein [Nitrosopumilus sp.]MDA7998883.1 hypothetical protein [Nitrosopumilus sp.]